MNASHYLLWTALILVGAHSARGQAIVEGVVALPRPESVPAPSPRYGGQAAQMAVPDPPRAVVYLEGQFPASATNAPPGTNVVQQQGMQFRPALLPVRVGTTVVFPNGDDFYHNVFSYSKAKRFDLGRYRKEDKPAMEVFDKPGVVRLYCEIHRNMRGAILVLDTPYFTCTDTNGAYRLQNLPPGQYLLKAWVDEKRVGTQSIDLQTGKTLHVNFDLK